MAINKVEFGGQTLIDLTADTITTADLMQNKTAHDKAGNSITGAFTLDTELTAQDSKIVAIKEALKGKGTPPAAKPVIKPLDVTSNGTYNVPSGTDGYNPVKVNCPVPKAEQVKTMDITANGTVSIKPDPGKVLSEAIAKVNIPTGGGTVEMVSVKLEYMDFYTDKKCICYVDDKGSVIIKDAISYGSETLKIPKNSLLAIGIRDFLYAFPTSAFDIALRFENEYGASIGTVYYVKSDCTIQIGLGE